MKQAKGATKPGLGVTLVVVGLTLVAACATAKIAQYGDAPVAKPPAEGDRYFEPAPLPPGPEVVEGYAGLAEHDASELSVARGDLDTFIQQGPRFALTLVHVQPAFRSGQFAGFEVVSLTDGGSKVFGHALKKGDVVVKINDYPISRPEDYMAAWGSLKDCDKIVVELVRAGETVVKTWPVRSSNSQANAGNAGG